MYLKDLVLRNYRNYSTLALSFDARLVLLIGRNAQGKTNVLESVYLCCTGRSHRTTKDKELIQWQQDSAYVKARVQKAVGESVLEMHLKGHEKKRILINSTAAQRLGDLMGHLNTVMFSPEDLKLVKEGPLERRRFMDIELSQIRPKYFYSLQQYNRILNQRNNLLKELRMRPALKNTLPVWNHQLAETAAYITDQRRQFHRALQRIAREIHRDISYRTEELTLLYRSSIPWDRGTLPDIKEAYLKLLEQKEREDIERGSTSLGCHRDDILIQINGTDVRAFGSQGQQRTTALSLKLSELVLMEKETGEAPVLLLDDVMSELDPKRQRMLLEHIGRVQTFITATDSSQFPDVQDTNREVYRVSEGCIMRME